MPGLPNIPQEIILAVIEKLGPCQPLDIYREVRQGDTVLIGAMLSELVAQGKLLITKIKRGGSPFYYDPNKPERLDGLSKYLNQKDQRTYAMLREQRVMREDAQDPLVRVGLQNMPDFSKRITTNISSDDVVFWRYYMIDDNEAQRLVKGGKPTTKQAEFKTIENEVVKETDIVEKLEKEEKIENEEKIANEKTEKAVIHKVETAEKSQKRSKKTKIESTVEADAASGAESEKIPVKSGKSKKRAKKSPAPTIMPDGAVMISPQEWLEHDTLYEKVRAFAGGEVVAGRMVLRDARVHKPHSELTCILSIDVSFGKIDMFVHAFNRKFTPEDVKATMPQARELGLPVLILSVDPIQSKVTAAFKGMPNIFFKQFDFK